MYQFTNDCHTGIPQIDEEHEKLFKMINDSIDLLHNQDAAPASARNLVDELRKYAAVHFAHEEAYMKEHHDPELPRQEKEHRAFAAKINAIDLDDPEEEGSREKYEALLKYLVNWLYHHILGSDIMIGKLAPLVEEKTDPFAFTDNYRTGITLVDDEHKKLFEIIRNTNDVIHAEYLHDKYDQIVHILGQLKDYTVLHFHDEEEYMKSIHYAGIDAQIRAHEAFVTKIEEINLDDVEENQEQYLDGLIEFLLGWLSNHIMKMDKLIK